ncbi:hypothetical protein HY639_05945 [Candidatus Woesearchaeota archaeon]|nr:hypothetical protein [Candidatus Woesearchaeota archaeon]
MLQEEQQKIHANLTTSDLKPVFADDVLVGQTIKQNKLPDGKMEKEGVITFFFLDMMTQKPIAKVVISRLTAQNLHNLLGDTLQKMIEELKSEKETVHKVSIQAQEKHGYIG